MRLRVSGIGDAPNSIPLASVRPFHGAATRLKQIVPMGTEGAPFEWCVSPMLVEREFPGASIRPEFRAGDVVAIEGELIRDAEGGAQAWGQYPRYLIRSIRLVERK